MENKFSIKQQLSNIAKELFWDLFLKTTKKDNTYTIHFIKNWDEQIVNKIKYWQLQSWWALENKQIELHDIWFENWQNFSKQAYLINEEFGKWFNDSDRWFVPNNYLDYRFER